MFSTSLKAACFFEGVGGTTYGLTQAGIEVVYANEINKIFAESYQLNNGDHMHVADIKNVRGSDLPAQIDLATCTAPCQSFSTSGQRKNDDPRDGLIAEFQRILRERPDIPCFLLENVRGLTTGRKKPIFENIKRAFEELGFYVQFKIYNALDFGVPQVRNRLIMVGTRFKTSNFQPAAESFDATRLTRRAVIEAAAGAGLNRKVYAEPKDILRILAKKDWKWSEFCAMHALDKPLGTVTASANIFGFDANYVLEINENLRRKQKYDIAPRVLTLPEALLAQSFPHDWQLVGSRNERYTQIGNAVPPRFAAALGRGILQLFHDRAE